MTKISLSLFSTMLLPNCSLGKIIYRKWKFLTHFILLCVMSLSTFNTEIGIPIKFNYKVSILNTHAQNLHIYQHVIATISWRRMLFTYRTIVFCTLSLLAVPMTRHKIIYNVASKIININLLII